MTNFDGIFQTIHAKVDTTSHVRAMTDTRPTRCPCGSGDIYTACCRPFHDGEAAPATAQLLMRSRYSAFAVRNSDYLRSSWHHSTRPAEIELDDAVTWTLLEIIDTDRGSPLDTEGIVEFRAHYRSPQGRRMRHERSRFTRDAGRWYYVDGDTFPS
jgi:SEC-C motif-containing protein